MYHRALQGCIDLAISTEEVQTAEGAREEAEMAKVGVGVLLGPLESVASALTVSASGAARTLSEVLLLHHS